MRTGLSDTVAGKKSPFIQKRPLFHYPYSSPYGLFLSGVIELSPVNFVNKTPSTFIFLAKPLEYITISCLALLFEIKFTGKAFDEPEDNDSAKPEYLR